MTLAALPDTDIGIVFFPRPQQFRLQGREVDGWLESYDDEPGQLYGRRRFAIVVTEPGGTAYRIPLSDLID